MFLNLFSSFREMIHIIVDISPPTERLKTEINLQETEPPNLLLAVVAIQEMKSHRCQIRFIIFMDKLLTSNYLDMFQFLPKQNTEGQYLTKKRKKQWAIFLQVTSNEVFQKIKASIS